MCVSRVLLLVTCLCPTPLFSLDRDPDLQWTAGQSYRWDAEGYSTTLTRPSDWHILRASSVWGRQVGLNEWQWGWISKVYASLLSFTTLMLSNYHYIHTALIFFPYPTLIAVCCSEGQVPDTLDPQRCNLTSKKRTREKRTYLISGKPKEVYVLCNFQIRRRRVLDASFGLCRTILTMLWKKERERGL